MPANPVRTSASQARKRAQRCAGIAAQAAREARRAHRSRPGPASAAALRRRDAPDAAARRASRPDRAGRSGGRSRPQIQFRPKRMLVCRTRDGDEELYLRFFNFYPSQLKQLAAGARLRVMGEITAWFLRRRDGPSALSRCCARAEPLPRVAHARVSDHRRAGAAHAAQADRAGADARPICRTRCRPRSWRAGSWPASATACATCTTRRPTRRRTSCRSARIRPGAASSSTSCWRSNCPCGCTTGGGRRRMRLRLHGTQRLAARLLAALPFKLTRAQARALGGDPRGSGQAASDAAAAAGRCGQRQDRRCGAGRLAGGRERLPGRGDGADRNPRRTALRQVLAAGWRRSASQWRG